MYIHTEQEVITDSKQKKADGPTLTAAAAYLEI